MIEEKRPFIAPAGSHEQTPHGTSLFPVANYELSFPGVSISWHWHDDWEYILCTHSRVKCSTAEGEVILDQVMRPFWGRRLVTRSQQKMAYAGFVPWCSTLICWAMRRA